MTPGRWRSIDRRLPLLISVLLLAAIVAMSWTAYRRIQQLLISVAGEQLSNASRSFSEDITRTGVRFRMIESRVARDSTVRLALTGKSSAASARAAMARWIPSSQSVRERVALLDSTGALIAD